MDLASYRSGNREYTGQDFSSSRFLWGAGGFSAEQDHSRYFSCRKIISNLSTDKLTRLCGSSDMDEFAGLVLLYLHEIYDGHIMGGGAWWFCYSSRPVILYPTSDVPCRDDFFKAWMARGVFGVK